jgi:hypothetical protein
MLTSLKTQRKNSSIDILHIRSMAENVQIRYFCSLYNSKYVVMCIFGKIHKVHSILMLQMQIEIRTLKNQKLLSK